MWQPLYYLYGLYIILYTLYMQFFLKNQLIFQNHTEKPNRLTLFVSKLAGPLAKSYTGNSWMIS